MVGKVGEIGLYYNKPLKLIRTDGLIPLEKQVKGTRVALGSHLSGPVYLYICFV